jgi:hypothetical protein
MNLNDEREERRLQWIAILKECAMYHNEQVEKLKSPIIGASETEEAVMHKVWCLAIMDAVGLVEVLPLIDEDNEGKDGLPQDNPGPAG